MADPLLGPAHIADNAPWDTHRLRKALHQRFFGDAWAVLEEVPNGTGSRKDRCADAVVMSLWPSNGLTLQGVEIKASRADWLNEVKDATKADAIKRYCDQWWLVIASGDMVKPGELPDDWGMMVPDPAPHSLRGLRIVKAAPILTPMAVDRTFLASLLRRVHESSATDRDLEAEYHRGIRDGWDYAEHANERLKAFRRAMQMIYREASVVMTNAERILKHAPKHEK